MWQGWSRSNILCEYSDPGAVRGKYCRQCSETCGRGWINVWKWVMGSYGMRNGEGRTITIIIKIITLLWLAHQHNTLSLSKTPNKSIFKKGHDERTRWPFQVSLEFCSKYGQNRTLTRSDSWLPLQMQYFTTCNDYLQQKSTWRCWSLLGDSVRSSIVLLYEVLSFLLIAR